MPNAPEGYTHIEDAPAKWGRNRVWWYEQVKEGALVGYKMPGDRATYVKDEDVAAFLTMKPINRDRDSNVG